MSAEHEPVTGEIVDGEPVEVVRLSQTLPVRTLEVTLPALGPAAAAASGFIAGAATLVLARKLGGRRLARAGLSRSSLPAVPLGLGPIVSSRTYIVRVHRLGHPGQ